MKIRMSRAHCPVTVLGPGRRVGLWVQGCSLGCKGCVSRDTWSDEGGRPVEVAEVLDWIRTEAADADGVTISGGEPFQQPEALAELLDGLDAWRRSAGREIDILSFSGYKLPWLRRHRAAILDKLDVVISELFREDLPTDLVLRGSANQILTPLSDLGHRRFDALVNASRERPEMQFAVEGEVVWMIGIPGRGDMDRVAASSRAHGVAYGNVSWSA